MGVVLNDEASSAHLDVGVELGSIPGGNDQRIQVAGQRPAGPGTGRPILHAAVLHSYELAIVVPAPTARVWLVLGNPQGFENLLVSDESSGKRGGGRDERGEAPGRTEEGRVSQK